MDSTFILKRVSDGHEFSLDQVSMLIGRSGSCDICVETAQASREHARITTMRGSVKIQDLHSTNGTQVNGNDIHDATELRPGDVVKVGDVSFSLQEEDNSDATIVMRPMSLDAGDSSSSIMNEDDSEEDCTIVHQSYPLPQGWSEYDQDSGAGDSEAEKRKKEAIDRYLGKLKSGKEGVPGIALIFFVEQNPPVIKALFAGEQEVKWSFGRSKNCDVSIDNPCISDTHAFVAFSKSQWSLEDNQSTNGLWVKNKKLQSCALTDSLKINIGTVELLIRLI